MSNFVEYWDANAWEDTADQDLWIFDKFILSRRLGYLCGAKGVDVPKPGYYVTRPCVNFLGMGLGAEFQYLSKKTDELKDGFFWCEIFEGRHLSVDYVKKQQVLCVEGFREYDLGKWEKWEKTDDQIAYPEILNELLLSYPCINVEFIGGKVIEVHLRSNPDFEDHDSSYVIPVWIGEKVFSGLKFISRPDGERLGFYIEEKEND